jgi:hypothetical protein
MDPAWIGTCRSVTVKLVDGTTGSFTFSVE